MELVLDRQKLISRKISREYNLSVPTDFFPFFIFSMDTLVNSSVFAKQY